MPKTIPGNINIKESGGDITEKNAVTIYVSTVVVDGASSLGAYEISLSAIPQIEAEDTVIAEGNADATLIPFHTINVAIVNSREVEQSTPSDDNCGGGGECSHDTIQVWPDGYETPLPWWSERIVLGSSPYPSSSFIGFTLEGVQGNIQNFTAESADTSVATASVTNDGWNNKLLIEATNISGGVETTVTVSFPDYSCDITLMIEVIGK